jgi:hypothetical protein
MIEHVAHASALFAASRAIRRVFGAEWNAPNFCGRRAVLEDFISADCSAAEYARRIRLGNLQAYANCLLVGSAGGGYA